MSKTKFHPCPISFMPKENTLGMDGMNEIFISSPHRAIHAGDVGHDWEWMGMDEPKQGMFFHSFDADGRVEHQGCLLVLTAAGFGRAQLFEWFWGEPSTEIEATPDYLRTCIFYASAAAMNAAYERREPLQ